MRTKFGEILQTGAEEAAKIQVRGWEDIKR